MDKLEDILERVRNSRLPSQVIITLFENIYTIKCGFKELSRLEACKEIFNNNAVDHCTSAEDVNLCMDIQAELLEISIKELNDFSL